MKREQEEREQRERSEEELSLERTLPAITPLAFTVSCCSKQALAASESVGCGRGCGCEHPPKLIKEPTTTTATGDAAAKEQSVDGALKGH